jgi:pyridoxamine 5'-phosphate oxidase-like protein
MGQTYQHIDSTLEHFIRSQHMFFVATAPLSGEGHVNLSPKGLDTLRVVDPGTLAYLDYVGSGAETIAHLRENRRIVIMVCAFQGPPRIVRVHGRGDVIEPTEPEFHEMRALFPAHPDGRAIIRVAIERIADSCGFGVPLFAFEGDRSQLPDWAVRKGEQGLRQYQKEKNSKSIDGLLALRWTESVS